MFLTVSLLAGLGLSALWYGPIENALGVIHCNAQKEMISLPAATVASLVADGEIDSVPTEIGQVDTVALAAGWEASPDNSDSFRMYFWPALDEGRGDEVRDYLTRIVIEHPGHCASCLLLLARPAWDPSFETTAYNAPGAPYGYDVTDTSVFACTVESPGVLASKNPELYQFFWSVSRDANYGGRPYLALLCSPAVFLWITCFLFIRAVSRHQHFVTAATGLFLLIAATIWLGPTQLPRYYAYLYFCLPIIIGIALIPSAKDGRIINSGEAGDVSAVENGARHYGAKHLKKRVIGPSSTR